MSSTKIAAIIAAILTLSAVSSSAQEIKIKEYKGSRQYREVQSKNAPTCTVSFTLELPVQGLSSSSAYHIVPTLIENCLGKKYSHTQDINAAIQSCLDETYKSCKEDLDMTGTDNDWPVSYFYDYSVNYVSTIKNIIQFTYSSSIYMGGAHPMYLSESFNFDMTTGREILLSDIIKDGSAAAITAMIKKVLEANEIEYWESDEFTLWNYTIEPEGICFWFNRYEIAPYIYGCPSATLSWEQLKPYLKMKF